MVTNDAAGGLALGARPYSLPTREGCEAVTRILELEKEELQLVLAVVGSDQWARYKQWLGGERGSEGLKVNELELIVLTIFHIMPVAFLHAHFYNEAPAIPRSDWVIGEYHRRSSRLSVDKRLAKIWAKRRAEEASILRPQDEKAYILRGHSETGKKVKKVGLRSWQRGERNGKTRPFKYAGMSPGEGPQRSAELKVRKIGTTDGDEGVLRWCRENASEDGWIPIGRLANGARDAIRGLVGKGDIVREGNSYFLAGSERKGKHSSGSTATREGVSMTDKGIESVPSQLRKVFVEILKLALPKNPNKGLIRKGDLSEDQKALLKELEEAHLVRKNTNLMCFVEKDYFPLMEPAREGKFDDYLEEETAQPSGSQEVPDEQALGPAQESEGPGDEVGQEQVPASDDPGTDTAEPEQSPVEPATGRPVGDTSPETESGDLPQATAEADATVIGAISINGSSQLLTQAQFQELLRERVPFDSPEPGLLICWLPMTNDKFGFRTTMEAKILLQFK